LLAGEIVRDFALVVMPSVGRVVDAVGVFVLPEISREVSERRRTAVQPARGVPVERTERRRRHFVQAEPVMAFFHRRRIIAGRENRIKLSIFHLNIRSLNENHEELCEFLSTIHHEFDVIILSEMWSYNVILYRPSQ